MTAAIDPVKNITIVLGLGVTGIACLRYLTKQAGTVIAMDTRQNPPELNACREQFPEVPVYLGELDETLLSTAQTIVVSPGLSLQTPAIQLAKVRGVSVIGDIELFARAARAKIVAITGSNAKGTVTTLLGDMAASAGLNVRVGGNIGRPALDLLDINEPDLYVLELSSFQLETTDSLKTIAATILNISPDHLDRYSDLAAYIAAKQRIYRHCSHPVYNRDDSQTQPIQQTSKCVSFGLTSPADQEWGLKTLEGEIWLAKGHHPLMKVSALRIQGRHNWANALAALALGDILGLPLDAMLKTLHEFPGLPHRCQWVMTRNDVQWYNDSKGTNVGATLAALTGLGQSITGKIVLILGGLGKGADFRVLRESVLNYVRHVILLGQDAPLIAAALGEDVPLVYATDMSQAVCLADSAAQAGDIVLLSPACASYDMFHNFEHRGDVYVNEVRSLS